MTAKDARLRRLLNGFLRRMSETSDLDRLLRHAFEMLGGIVRVDAMFVAVLDEAGHYFKLLETDLDDAGRRVFCVPQPMQATAPALEALERERYVLICRSAAELRRLEGKFGEREPWSPVGNPGRRSATLLYVPLWEGPRYSGALSVQSYTRNAYGRGDAERVCVVAEYVALAIRHARTDAGRRRRG